MVWAGSVRCLVRTEPAGEAGREAALVLLGRADRPTAVLTANDLRALGVYQAARESRLTIPGDLSVVGFDDLPVASWVEPPLTTVHQPLVEPVECTCCPFGRVGGGLWRSGGTGTATGVCRP